MTRKASKEKKRLAMETENAIRKRPPPPTKKIKKPASPRKPPPARVKTSDLDPLDGDKKTVMPHFTIPEDHATLVRIVYEIRRKGIRGSKGRFDEFIHATFGKERPVKKGTPRKISTNPHGHSSATLLDFVLTLNQSRDQLKLVRRHYRHLQHMKARIPASNCVVPDSPDGQTWRLVQQTEAHSAFSERFTFPSYDRWWKFTDFVRKPFDKTWTKAVRGGVRLLGVDCEMCETSKGGKELLSFTVVDEDGEVLMDRVVRPRGSIIDLRTQITGFSAEDMADVSLHWRTARNELVELIRRLQGQTSTPVDQPKVVVLVGHAINNDLKALKIDHRPVIDTSIIFQFKGLSQISPSLADVYQATFGVPMREEGKAHSSEKDAMASLALALHARDKGIAGTDLPVPTTRVPLEQQCRLLIHNIHPVMRKPELFGYLWEIFPANCRPDTIEPVEGQTRGVQWEKSNPNRPFKVEAVFPSVAAVSEAFKGIVGRPERDPFGRHQKLSVQVPVAKHQLRLFSTHRMPKKGAAKVKGHAMAPTVTVRKMAAHAGLLMAPRHAK